ncbi:MAG: purine-nucleoside phosphorylase [Streptococcaceae bacterium]|jgi:purine-nucleoside phosphorylase|nr:purine-nucleoside phosphorylase [Streptococcaceae bacterium]
MLTLQEKLSATTTYLKNKGIGDVDIALILGSGLGELAEEVTDTVIVPYSEIPHFPVSTVVGHAGQLVYGTLSGKKVLAMQGRFHYYEGNPMDVVIYPVRVFAKMGVESLLVTNAAGGVNEAFHAGDLMLITDHINFIGENPLMGANDDEIGPRFPDMSEAYTKGYQDLAREVAKTLGVTLQEGVYLANSGPSYETPAEIRMARVLGASAVGMSTVPEVIAAAHAGMKVLGISCITNLAAGMQSELNHAEVVATTERVKEDFKRLVKAILEKM